MRGGGGGIKAIPRLPAAAPAGYPSWADTPAIQACYDLSGGNEIVGHRAANLTKTIGVTTLDAGMSYDGTFVTITGSNRIITGWDFTNAGGVEFQGTGAVFTDCRFLIGATAFYAIQGTSGASAACNHCTFDGTNMRAGASSYHSGSGTLTLDHCFITHSSSDYGKSSTAGFSATDCYYLCNGNAAVDDQVHIDFHQMDAGSATFTRCFFDARGWTGGGFGAAVNNYVRIESNGGAITGCSVIDCIGIGQADSGGLHPFQVAVNPNAISNVVFTGNRWAPGAGGQYFYPSNTSAITTWSGNKEITNLATYSAPNDTSNPAP